MKLKELQYFVKLNRAQIGHISDSSVRKIANGNGTDTEN